MKLNIKDFSQHKKLWIGLGLALLLAVGGWYYFWIYQPDQQRTQSDNQFAQMVAFEVKDPTIPRDVQDKYFETFDVARTYFTAHQHDLLAYDALLKMGLIKQLVGDYTGAEQIFLYVYDLQTDGYILNGNLGHLYLYYLKDYPKAEKFYLKAISSARGNNLYSYYTEMYDLYHDGFKDPAKTQDLLKKALVAIPDSSNLANLAGSYYKSIGNILEARKYYELAQKINPKDEVSRNALENL